MVDYTKPIRVPEEFKSRYRDPRVVQLFEDGAAVVVAEAHYSNMWSRVAILSYRLDRFWENVPKERLEEDLERFAAVDAAQQAAKVDFDMACAQIDVATQVARGVVPSIDLISRSLGKPLQTVSDESRTWTRRALIALIEEVLAKPEHSR